MQYYFLGRDVSTNFTNFHKDITDKFDYSFICGDLNFRLNISRLHADWLISREGMDHQLPMCDIFSTFQEFTQALEFDQLRKVMEEGTEFLGFHEAPINFPPTFKYDVAPHSKYTKGNASKSMRLERAGDNSTTLTDLEERALEELENGEANETASMASSTSTSVKSKVWDRESDGECIPSPSTPTMVTSVSKASVASTGTRKAKLKWFTLPSPSLSSPTALFRPKQQHASTPRLGDFPPPRNYHNYNLQGKSGHDSRPPMILVDASKPNTNNDGTPISEERGIYDSSNKRRVPSWCVFSYSPSRCSKDSLPGVGVIESSGNPLLYQTSSQKNMFQALLAGSDLANFWRVLSEHPLDDLLSKPPKNFRKMTKSDKNSRSLPSLHFRPSLKQPWRKVHAIYSKENLLLLRLPLLLYQ